MLTLRFGPSDLANSRFAISPVFELENLLRALSGRSKRALNEHWAAPLRRRFHELRRQQPLDALLALQRSPYAPSFIAPPPSSVDQTIEQDLEAIRRTPPEVARAEIDFALGLRPRTHPTLRHLLDRPDVVDLIAHLLDKSWQALLDPGWQQLRLLLLKDLEARAKDLSTFGWARAFHDLHSTVAWRDDVLEIAHEQEQERDLDGSGALLMPSLLVWPGVAVYLEPPWRPTIAYPARDSEGLLAPSSSQSSGGMANVLGSTRARLLARLQQPTTTSRLVADLGLAQASVSEQLGHLLAAGLVTKQRHGRSVIYSLTALGAALAETCPPPGAAIPG